MTEWPDQRIQNLFGIELPIIQAPMAGSAFAELVIAVSAAGGLGSLACAMLNATQLREQVETIRSHTPNPINLNFFCHRPPTVDNQRTAAWENLLAKYYREFDIERSVTDKGPSRAPFDKTQCDLVVELRPAVVSFHFGLPAEPLLERVRASGAKIISSATSVEEARWLEARGCDAIRTGR